jgi:hypothetical protein
MGAWMFVTLGEDESLIRLRNVAMNFSFLCRTALNLLRANSSRSLSLPRKPGQPHYEGEEARGEEVEEKLREGIAINGLERFAFDAKRRKFVLFEEIEGETAEDGKGLRGVSSSDARATLHSAIALHTMALRDVTASGDHTMLNFGTTSANAVAHSLSHSSSSREHSS